MVIVGDLQRQLASLLAQANSQGLNPKDVLPQEVEDHFVHSASELKAAKEYITEVEEREQLLHDCNDALQKELKKAKQAVKDLPADHEARLVDLKQAEHHIKFYKGLMDAAEDRATQYQQKWQEALAQQTAADETENKIHRLERELLDNRITITKLVEENRGMSNIFETLRAKDLRTLENKEMKLMEMEKAIRETEERYQKLEEESERFEQTYTGIVEQMDNETINCADAINKTAVKLDHAQSKIRRNEKLRMATVSEIQPLRRFYDRCFDILLIHQRLFVQLFSIERNEVTYIPDTLVSNLKSATSELEYFHVMRATMESEGVECDVVREQLTALAFSASRVHDSIQSIAADVMRFVTQLDRRPDLLTVMRFKYLRR
jgi:chromosome segregation ATPase